MICSSCAQKDGNLARRCILPPIVPLFAELFGLCDRSRPETMARRAAAGSQFRRIAAMPPLGRAAAMIRCRDLGGQRIMELNKPWIISVTMILADRAVGARPVRLERSVRTLLVPSPPPALDDAACQTVTRLPPSPAQNNAVIHDSRHVKCFRIALTVIADHAAHRHPHAPSVTGSINLTGARIDDLVLTRLSPNAEDKNASADPPAVPRRQRGCLLCGLWLVGRWPERFPDRRRSGRRTARRSPRRRRSRCAGRNPTGQIFTMQAWRSMPIICSPLNKGIANTGTAARSSRAPMAMSAATAFRRTPIDEWTAHVGPHRRRSTGQVKLWH